MAAELKFGDVVKEGSGHWAVVLGRPAYDFHFVDDVGANHAYKCSMHTVLIRLPPWEPGWVGITHGRDERYLEKKVED
jgi:hypothetical protein